MTTLQKLISALFLVAAAAGCATEPHVSGKACERCSRGYYPIDDHDHRRAICVQHDRVMNCDRIPAQCDECARIQRHDMGEREPYTR